MGLGRGERVGCGGEVKVFIVRIEGMM